MVQDTREVRPRERPRVLIELRPQRRHVGKGQRDLPRVQPALEARLVHEGRGVGHARLRTSAIAPYLRERGGDDCRSGWLGVRGRPGSGISGAERARQSPAANWLRARPLNVAFYALGCVRLSRARWWVVSRADALHSLASSALGLDDTSTLYIFRRCAFKRLSWPILISACSADREIAF